MNPLYVWTGDDYEHHLCRADQIGTPKPTPSSEQNAAPEDVLASLPPSSMAELKQAALRVARGSMGYDEFLRKNPAFLQKFLLSMAKEQDRLPPQPLVINVPWLTPQRLSYKDRVEDVIPTLIESTPTTSEAPSSWKEPAPNAELAHEVNSFIRQLKE